MCSRGPLVEESDGIKSGEVHGETKLNSRSRRAPQHGTTYRDVKNGNPTGLNEYAIERRHGQRWTLYRVSRGAGGKGDPKTVDLTSRRV